MWKYDGILGKYEGMCGNVFQVLLLELSLSLSWCGVFDGDQVGDRSQEVRTHLVAVFLKLIGQLFGRTPAPRPE